MPPKDQKAKGQAKPPPSPVKTAYLVLYNAVSAAAWSVVLFRTAAALAAPASASSGSGGGGPGYTGVFPAVGEWTKWTQTLAALEVLHSLLGIVRAPLTTTLMQVSSRFLLVWLVVHPFPHLAVLSPFYASMLAAWSVTEVIRYTFFAVGLSTGLQPAPLVWLRYNTFFVLYPLGITSECALVYLAADPAGRHWGDVYRYALYGVLAVYVPGAYTLYTHMMAQRRKVMRSLKSKDAKAQ